jgi:hypothetical protein
VGVSKEIETLASSWVTNQRIDRGNKQSGRGKNRTKGKGRGEGEKAPESSERLFSEN